MRRINVYIDEDAYQFLKFRKLSEEVRLAIREHIKRLQENSVTTSASRKVGDIDG